MDLPGVWLVGSDTFLITSC